MNLNFIRLFPFLVVLLTSFFPGCREAGPLSSPPGYDLASPKKFPMDDALREISGICFLRGNPDTLYAEEDEEGKIFYFHLGDGKFPFKKVAKRGDYEDLTVLDNKEFVLLRSDGSLFVFPVNLVHEAGSKEANEQQVRSYEQILPAGEYEGLYGDDDGRLIALCKNCSQDDQHKEVSAYVLQYNARHDLAITSHFQIDVSGLKHSGLETREKFHPSCLARHPLTREWYLISSTGKVLLVLDEKWNLKKAYPLDPSVFRQPEGLAFDRKGNMYISNEGEQGRANVLLFNYSRH